MADVFVSYVSEDRELARKLYSDLSSVGVDIWIDEKNLRPGVRWPSAIRDAINGASFFLACFSGSYVARSVNYMNEELNQAVERIRMTSINEVWFIPVLLTECEIPPIKISSSETLRIFQAVRLYKGWANGVSDILSVIRRRAANADVPIPATPIAQSVFLLDMDSCRQHFIHLELASSDGVVLMHARVDPHGSHNWVSLESLRVAGLAGGSYSDDVFVIALLAGSGRTHPVEVIPMRLPGRLSHPSGSIDVELNCLAVLDWERSILAEPCTEGRCPGSSRAGSAWRCGYGDAVIGSAFMRDNNLRLALLG